jgi:dTDP-glucose pyrophosphorylase
MEQIEKAVILAAGRGTRLGELTRSVPKPMLPIAGRPMLEHILDRLNAAGIGRFLIVTGYQREAIENYFRVGRFSVQFAVQEPVNGTESAALLGHDFCESDSFLLTYGDIICASEEYSRAIGKLGPGADAVLAVKSVDDPWQGAAVYASETGRITRIVEKPPKGSSTTNWNSAGFYCFRSQIFSYLQNLTPSARGEYELTSAIDAMLNDGRVICISEIEGAWRDVGRPEDLAAANA